jgi:hypothetical protein
VASVASTGESFFARTKSAISHAERHVSIDGRIVSFRVVETFDRRGALVADIAWTAGGALQIGWVRIPDGSWLAIEPRAAVDAPWGLSDRISHAVERGSADRTSVTLFETLDWARVDRIPTLAEPARLPPGAGTAVLNLVAELARAQGVGRLAYRGPYPTEQLFTTLLESFRYVGAAADPLAAFLAGGVEWEPAPHERFFPAEGLYVQLRGRVEKVVFRGAAYYRADWQGVARHAPKRVRDTRAGVVCSLWALGRPLEDHLLLSRDGELLRVLEPEPETPPPPRTMFPEIQRGIAATVAAVSAPALAPFIRSAAEDAPLEWDALSRELVAAEPGRIRVSTRLRSVLVELMGAARGRGERASLALAAVVELAALAGDTLRARAQAALRALAPEAQAAALAAGEAAPPGDARGAQEIAGAVEVLLDELSV